MRHFGQIGHSKTPWREPKNYWYPNPSIFLAGGHSTDEQKPAGSHLRLAFRTISRWNRSDADIYSSDVPSRRRVGGKHPTRPLRAFLRSGKLVQDTLAKGGGYKRHRGVVEKLAAERWNGL